MIAAVCCRIPALNGCLLESPHFIAVCAVYVLSALMGSMSAPACSCVTVWAAVFAACANLLHGSAA